MLLSEVKQQGGCGVVTECVLEIGNQIIPADNGFLLGGKVLGKSSVSCPLKPSDSAPLC